MSILPCWLGRVLIVRGLLVTDKLLDVWSVTAPDAVSQIVEEFEDGACLLGCPFGIDDELDSTPEFLDGGSIDTTRPFPVVIGQLPEVAKPGGAQKHLTNRHSPALGAWPVGGLVAAPLFGLGIQIVEVLELAGDEEGLPDVANGALDAALFVAPRHGDGTKR